MFGPVSLLPSEVFVSRGRSWQPSRERAPQASSKSPSSQSRKSSPVLLGHKNEADRKEGNLWTRNTATVLRAKNTHTYAYTGTSNQSFPTPTKIGVFLTPHWHLVWFILCFALLNRQVDPKQLAVADSGFLHLHMCAETKKCAAVLQWQQRFTIWNSQKFGMRYQIWWMGGYFLEPGWFILSLAKFVQRHISCTILERSECIRLFFTGMMLHTAAKLFCTTPTLQDMIDDQDFM